MNYTNAVTTRNWNTRNLDYDYDQEYRNPKNNVIVTMVDAETIRTYATGAGQEKKTVGNYIATHPYYDGHLWRISPAAKISDDTLGNTIIDDITSDLNGKVFTASVDSPYIPKTITKRIEKFVPKTGITTIDSTIYKVTNKVDVAKAKAPGGNLGLIIIVGIVIYLIATKTRLLDPVTNLIKGKSSSVFR